MLIPVLVLFGAVAGRWPWAAIAVATVAWPLLLWATSSATFHVGEAAALAAVNAAVGVVAHQAVLAVLRRLGRRDGGSPAGP